MNYAQKNIIIEGDNSNKNLSFEKAVEELVDLGDLIQLFNPDQFVSWQELSVIFHSQFGFRTFFHR